MKIILFEDKMYAAKSIEFCCPSMSADSATVSTHFTGGVWHVQGRATHFCNFCGKRVEVVVTRKTAQVARGEI